MIVLRNVLVATDFSDVSRVALAYGQTLAAQFSAALHVVHVVENIAAKSVSAEGFVLAAPQWQEDLEKTARTDLDQLLAREVSVPG
jgi:nucleotide-binding universal stress UspA family protein